ncbi:hypothetical protein MTP10_12110 [Nonomuraea sp. 3-1Str]|uniref:hypothetical protein n=1 Tax=Nonomuraea sp. 3-1Str TaxID=2929801 RepID=UPI00285B0C95|nr:hypothetical protein [Nonomuraea sp. 3-1Str]MDR8409484.1 hypothetical protein [Nonomuraea sp. 3-1Str]
METLLRLLAEIGPAVGMTAWLAAVVVGAFVMYVGVAMAATLFSSDEECAKTRYRVFRDLIQLFRGGRR